MSHFPSRQPTWPPRTGPPALRQRRLLQTLVVTAHARMGQPHRQQTVQTVDGPAGGAAPLPCAAGLFYNKPVPVPWSCQGIVPVSTDRIHEYLAQFAQTRSLMLDQLRRVVVGQADVIEQILAAIFTRGHCLLVGVPGLAKTLMVSAISQILDVSFKRIQFTPDLMPSDITGTMILDEQEVGKREFRFVKGPIFANVILADEINRTPPKTQAALLQAMQEREVTAGQDTHKLPDPFFVIATQNPIEQEGTYPLPEAQLDRFMFNVKVDYPSLEEEKRILSMAGRGEAVELTRVLSGKAIMNLQKLVHSVAVGDYVSDYIVRLVRASRPADPSAPDFVKKMVNYGAGPRASLFLAEAGRAFAAMDGRFSVALDDIRKAAGPVLRHRISTNFQAQAEGKTSDDLIAQLLASVGDPEVSKYEKRRR
jgi:MoxR-like ATPase